MFTKEPNGGGLFGRAADFLKEKATEGKEALERRSLVKTLTELVNLRQHTIAIEEEFGFLMTTLPMPDQLANLDLPALRVLCPENAEPILVRARTLEYKRKQVEQHVEWADTKINSLLDIGGNLYFSSLKDGGITRSMLRPLINDYTNRARNRGGVIASSNAGAALIAVEDVSLLLPVAVIPEGERRYLIAALYLTRFADDEHREARRSNTNRQMLAIMIGCGALENVSDPARYEVLSATLPSLLRAVRVGVQQDIVQMRQYAQKGAAYSADVEHILNGGEPNLDIFPDVSGFRSILHPDRNEEALLALADQIMEADQAEMVAVNAPPIPATTSSLDDADLAAKLRQQRQWVFNTSEGVLSHSTRAYPGAVLGVENPAQDLFERRMSLDKLSAEWPHKEDFVDYDAYRKAREPIDAAAWDLAAARCVRSLGELSPAEKVALFVVIAMKEAGAMSEPVVIGYRSLIAWGNSKCGFEVEAGAQSPVLRPGSAQLINDYLTARVPDYDGEIRALIERGRELAAATPYPSLKQELGDLLDNDTRASQGADIGGMLAYVDVDADETESAIRDRLIIGFEGARPIGFSGDESLLTVGAPGSGKSQAQVVPALILSAHSMVALDIKGELLDLTGGDLQERGVRVLKFSLLGDGSPAHGYNPMASLPLEKAGLWDAAVRMAELLLPSGGNTDKMWLGNSRQLLACHIAVVRLEIGEAATLYDVVRSVKGGRTIVDGEEIRQAVPERLNAMLDVAEAHDFVDLADEIAGLSSMVAGSDGVGSKIWQSIMLAVNPLMVMLTSEAVKVATDRSDWSPADLRASHTKLFLQVRDVDLDRFKPLLRVIIGQHLQALMDQGASRDAMPVTFLLDELPQLGAFPEVIRAIEVGRSSRVRVWGFVQNLQQIEAIYSKSDVLIASTAVQSFLSFDIETAEYLSKLWGSKHDALRDQRVPIVEPADFFKPDMRGKMVVCSRGGQPAVIDISLAHVYMPERLGKPFALESYAAPTTDGE